MKSFLEILGETIRKEIKNEILVEKNKHHFSSRENENFTLSKNANSLGNFASRELPNNHSNHAFSEAKFFENWSSIHTNEKIELTGIGGTNFTKRGKVAYGVKVKPRPAHKLNKEQFECWTLLRHFDLNLTENFSREELKQSWKRIAKKTHPDLGGPAKDFMSAMNAYRKLCQIFG